MPAPLGATLRRRGFEIVAIGLVGAVVLYPLVALLARALGAGRQSWSRALHLPGLGTTVINTLVLVVVASIVAMTIGTGLAWASSQLRPRWQPVAVFLCLVPVLVPSVAVTIGWTFLASPEVGYLNTALRTLPFVGGETGPLDVYSLPWIAVLPGVYLAPFVFLFVFAALRSLPASYADAARVSGAGWVRTQRRVTLPLVKPALVFSAVIVVLLAVGQFVIPMLLGARPRIDVLTTEIYQQSRSQPVDYGVAGVLSLPLIVLGLALVSMGNRLVGPIDRYGVIGGRGSTATTGRRWPLIVVAGYSLLVTIPPIIALGLVAFSPYWSGSIDVGSFTTDNFSAMWSNDLLRLAMRNTLLFTAIATAVSLVVCTGLALLMRFTSSRVTRWLVDHLVAVPLTIPAAVFGLAVFMSYGIGPVNWYGSQWLFVVAWTILLLPHGVRIVTSGLHQVGDDLVDAARVCGASPGRIVRRVLLPLLRPQLAGAAMIMCLIMIQEFGAASFLSTPRTPVMATKLYDTFATGTYAEVAAYALVMAALSASAVIALAVLSRPRRRTRTS